MSHKTETADPITRAQREGQECANMLVRTTDFFPTYIGYLMDVDVSCKRCGGHKFTRTYHGLRLHKTSFRFHTCHEDVEVQ